MSPGIRDPALNTAKCITEGHKPSMLAAGPYIRVILYLSLGFVVFISPLLSRYVWQMEKDTLEPHNQDNEEAIRKKKNTVKALCTFGYVFSVLGIVILIVALALSICYLTKNQASFDILIILGLIIVYCPVLAYILHHFDHTIPFGDREKDFGIPIVISYWS